MHQDDIATIILAGQRSTCFSWNQRVDGKTLLEHAIERSKLLTERIYVSIHSPADQREIEKTLPDIINEVRFIEDDRSIVDLKSPLLSVVTGIQQIQADFLIIHGIDYPNLTSLDLMRMYQLLQENPLEVITFKDSDDQLTTTLLGLDRRLTMRRMKILLDLNGQSMSKFFRSTLNTGILPITTPNHRMKRVCEPDQVEGSNGFDTEFGDLKVIRPEKKYQVYNKLKDKNYLKEEKLREYLMDELELWKGVETIIDSIEEDINSDIEPQ